LRALTLFSVIQVMQPEKLFRSAIEACRVGIVMTDRAGNIMLVNAEVERLFGYERDEMLGQPIDILTSADQRARYAEYRKNTISASEGENSIGRELSGRRKDGAEFSMELGLSLIDTDDGPMLLSVIVDISKHRRAERLRDEFVATVSHELRTPLTSISGVLSLLVSNFGATLPAGTVRLLKIAHANSQRLVRLVSGILDMEKIESGKLVFVLKRVDIRDLVERTIEANRALAEGFNVRITLDPDSDSGELRCDPNWLAQALGNLLSNAVKFSPPGEGVTVGICKCGGSIRVWVRDRGQGIPEAFRPRVFEKFAQADNSDARRNGGAGLGLSIVKQIVRRLGGEVGFTDAPGGGTQFRVDLPLADDAPSGHVIAARSDGRVGAALQS
jgi:PAS domain S-box-containing protein